ncbi:MAG TPA: AI-2E family transporter [Flavisolibacter sp.]
MTTQTPRKEDREFSRKVWTVAGILALTVILILLVRATFNVLLLVLAGVLIAVYFRTLAAFIARKTKIREGASLAISILASIIIMLLLFWMMGAKVVQQFTELRETLPGMVDNFKAKLGQSMMGRKVVEYLSSPDTQRNAQAIAQTFFRSTFGIIGDLYVVLFLGVFFTVSPRIYKNGIVQMVPPSGRDKATDVMGRVGVNLQKWLMGQLFAMIVVFILTASGLLIIGVPMWLVLAILAGLLNFIPNFGPLIALIPAVLVGLLQSPMTALWIAILYISVQIAESNFITPMIQQRLINIPPALIILAQLLIAPLTGGWGLVLATPLMVIIIVMVQELYVKKFDV